VDGRPNGQSHSWPLRETEKIAYEIAEAHDKGLLDHESSAPLHEKYTLVAPDVRWIIDIYNYLKEGPHAQSFANRMRRLDGPVYPKDEKPGNGSAESRNLLFEIVFGALLTQSGIPPLLNQGDNDGIYDLFGIPLFAECKRVAGIKGVRPNVKKAKEQLRRPLLRSMNERPCGIIAIDATKILNDGTRVMLSPNEENARFRLEQFGESVYCEAMREKLPPSLRISREPSIRAASRIA
jgi:hypothetical protein